MSTLVIFSCGATLCALPQTSVTKIVALPELSRPPTLPRILAGFANVAGEAIPVAAAVDLLGAEPGQPLDPLHQHVVFMRERDDAVLGLLVDRVADVRAIEADAITPCPDDATLNGCVEAMTTYADRPVHILSPERLLTAAESARLAELRAAEQERLDAWAPA